LRDGVSKSPYLPEPSPDLILNEHRHRYRGHPSQDQLASPLRWKLAWLEVLRTDLHPGATPLSLFLGPYGRVVRRYRPLSFLCGATTGAVGLLARPKGARWMTAGEAPGLPPDANIGPPFEPLARLPTIPCPSRFNPLRRRGPLKKGVVHKSEPFQVATRLYYRLLLVYIDGDSI
jgi:hypothetical protein